jgi:type II secretory pathway pseudopilin PulG
VASLALSVSEFRSSPSFGNAVGVAVDAAAVVIPGIPGGVGAIRAAARATEAAKTAEGAVDAAKGAAKAANLPKPPTGKGSVPPGQRDPKRVWSKDENAAKLQEQGGTCASCGKETSIDNAEGHHVERHADGGKTDADNQAVVCTDCHKDLHSAQ